MRTHPGAVLLAIALSALTGCAGETAPTPGTVRVTGRLVDAETGEPVARTRIYVHAFNDAIDHQVSLRPGGGPEFDLEMPEPEIRLRIPDLSHEYELFEETFVAENGALDVTVRLQPTHRIRLHGTVLWRDTDGTLRPTSEGDGNVRSIQLSAGSGVDFRTDDDGAYSVLAPRELLTIRSINTNYAHTPKQIDLSGETGDEFEFDIVLTPTR